MAAVTLQSSHPSSSRLQCSRSRLGKVRLNSALGVSPSTADFVNQVAISDMFEIQSSQLAAQRANEPAKGFASQMITAHQKTSNELKSVVQSVADASVPSDLDSSHQKMLDKLNSLTGTDFTKQYDKDQVSAHKDAVSLFRRYAKGGRCRAERLGREDIA